MIGAWPVVTEIPRAARRPPVVLTITTWATAASLRAVRSGFVTVTVSVAVPGRGSTSGTSTSASGPPVITGTGAGLARTTRPSTTVAYTAYDRFGSMRAGS